MVRTKSIVRWLRRIVSVAVMLLVGAAMAEGFFGLLLAQPRLLRGMPPGVVAVARTYYSRYDWNMIQADPDCARYDEGLTYTLRPGSCRFANREFATEVRVNSLGVRDAEDALAAPEVVFAGDSHTMGWGVEQEQAFPQQVKARLKLRGLNAGVPSYGTVREMRLLDRIDTRALRVLVVQYAANDDRENATFMERGDELPVRSRADYEHQVERVRRHRRYFFGGYLWRMVRDAARPPRDEVEPNLSAEEKARLFIHALLRATHADLSPVNIIAFEMNAWGAFDGSFAAALTREAARAEYPRQIRGMIVLDLRARFHEQDWFLLDGHPRVSAHAAIASVLVETLERLRARRVPPFDDNGPSSTP